MSGLSAAAPPRAALVRRRSLREGFGLNGIDCSIVRQRDAGSTAPAIAAHDCMQSQCQPENGLEQSEYGNRGRLIVAKLTGLAQMASRCPSDDRRGNPGPQAQCV